MKMFVIIKYTHRLLPLPLLPSTFPVIARFPRPCIPSWLLTCPRKFSCRCRIVFINLRCTASAVSLPQSSSVAKTSIYTSLKVAADWRWIMIPQHNTIVNTAATRDICPSMKQDKRAVRSTINEEFCQQSTNRISKRNSILRCFEQCTHVYSVHCLLIDVSGRRLYFRAAGNHDTPPCR